VVAYIEMDAFQNYNGGVITSAGSGCTAETVNHGEGGEERGGRRVEQLTPRGAPLARVAAAYIRRAALPAAAVKIVGYTPTTFIVKNSWGTGWGDKGYFQIAAEDVGSGKMPGVSGAGQQARCCRCCRRRCCCRCSRRMGGWAGGHF